VHASPRRDALAVVLSVSLLMIGLANTILNVALPTQQLKLGASSSQLQWTVDAYLLVFAGLLLLPATSATARVDAARCRPGWSCSGSALPLPLFPPRPASSSPAGGSWALVAH